ncbi:MAG: hypothetical protein HY707_04865, partial [Ignavibacteriae bacterium]|nr:hypothetical protein [Ignavibacteriota bacterium]
WYRKSDKEKIAKAKIKTISHYTYKYSFGKLDSIGIKTAFCKYDQQGNRVEDQEFGRDGKLQYRWIIEYDGLGRVSDATCRNEKSGDQSIDQKITYRYDDKSNVKITKYNYLGKVEQSELLKCDRFGDVVVDNGEDCKVNFDEQGKRIDSSCFNEYGRIKTRILYKYDLRGMLLETIRYTYIPAGSEPPAFTEISIYDSNGIVTEKRKNVQQYSDKNCIYKYARDGMMLEWTEYDRFDEPKEFHKFVYEYY